MNFSIEVVRISQGEKARFYKFKQKKKEEEVSRNFPLFNHSDS